MISLLQKHQSPILLIVLAALILAGCRSAAPGPALPIPAQVTSGAVTAVPTPAPAGNDATSSPLLIFTTQAGMVEVALEELQAAGLQVEPAQMALFHNGQSLPFWIGGDPQDPTLRFFARPGDSLYTTETVYWLGDAGMADLAGLSTAPPRPAAARPEAVAAGLTAPDGATMAVLALEQNKLYIPQMENSASQGSASEGSASEGGVQSGVALEQVDHWLWMTLPAPSSQVIDFDLSALSPGPAHLEVNVWATTQASQAPDHRLVVKLNGQELLSEDWDGKGAHTLQAAIPAGLLREGSNQVELSLPGLDGVAADIVALDRLTLTYPRLIRAEDDRLELFAAGETITLEGFSGPVMVYDVTTPAQERLVGESLAPGATFQTEAGQRYWLAGPRGYLAPARLGAPQLSPDLRSLAGDYLAIGPQEQLEAAQPLLDWRAGQGLTPQAAPLQAVYDQFGGGYPEPEAIRAFLKHAAQAWQLAPHYVLLLGDASYDPKGYLAPAEVNRLPVFLVPTVFGGETASDVGYAQLDGETWPPEQPAEATPLDLAVGRLPAQGPEQVEQVVKKILAYEQAPAGQEWQGRVLAIADGQEAGFQLDAQNFLDRFGEHAVTELIAPPAGEAGVNLQILDRLNQGDGLVAYFGHGSLNMWGKDSLFTTADVANLDNAGRLPVVLNMTCLTGLFTHPKAVSMAETFLWQPDGGAVAVLAPTSLTLPTDQGFLYQPLADGWISDQPPRLGDLLLEARNQIPVDSLGTRDVMRTFLLFGDPALKLR